MVSFRFNCESLYESEFLQHYPTPDLLNTTADKLRWYRLKNGYLQSEIADIIGVYRSTYIHYEETTRKFYELDKLQLLADLYKVDIECLLDDYMLFLYKGQGMISSFSSAVTSSEFNAFSALSIKSKTSSISNSDLSVVSVPQASHLYVMIPTLVSS